MTAVNSVISFAGIPSLPFGGVGESGFGRIHGPEGLKEFARAKAIARQRFRAPLTADHVHPHREDGRHGGEADHAAARQAPLTPTQLETCGQPGPLWTTRPYGSSRPGAVGVRR